MHPVEVITRGEGQRTARALTCIASSTSKRQQTSKNCHWVISCRSLKHKSSSFSQMQYLCNSAFSVKIRQKLTSNKARKDDLVTINRKRSTEAQRDNVSSKLRSISRRKFTKKEKKVLRMEPFSSRSLEDVLPGQRRYVQRVYLQCFKVMPVLYLEFFPKGHSTIMDGHSSPKSFLSCFPKNQFVLISFVNGFPSRVTLIEGEGVSTVHMVNTNVHRTE